MTVGACACVSLDAEPRTTTLSELNLQLQQKSLHSTLARINDELLKMSKITVETESAVVDANMACAEAVEVAKQVSPPVTQSLKTQEQLELRPVFIR